MKHILKLSLSLLMDQFVGIISGFMLVLCVSALFQNSLSGFFLAFCVCFGFYYFVTYNSAFKSGFHDKHRIVKDQSYKGYLYKGLIAAVIAALPLVCLFILCRITKATILVLYYMIFNMYWSWPMMNMFPNHLNLVMILAFVPMIVIPWCAYIAGYHNFMISDVILKFYKKMIEK